MQNSQNKSYTMGEIYEFKVKKPYSTYCELIDDKTGVTTYLQGTAQLKLFKDQTVRCRVIAFTEKHPKIELVDISDFKADDGLNDEKLQELMSKQGIAWNQKEFIRLLLTEEKERSFESQCHSWIRMLINKKIDLLQVKEDCSCLLELSELLDICKDNERELYQDRLTLIIEQLSYYIQAAEIMECSEEETEDNPVKFINSLFNKLKTSGYVYHPKKYFSILSCLFLRMPELMNNNIEELISIICQRDISNWEKEPFRSSLIKMLELFINESEGRIDKIKENKQLVNNLIQALSLQLMLLKDETSNDIADVRLNRARLCRISTYVVPSSSICLENSAFRFLLNPGTNMPIYTQNDVKNNLVPHFLSNLPACETINTINSFTQNKVKLLVSSNGIHIVPVTNKKSLNAVFPKELGLWKNLQIYLDTKIETSFANVKNNDITPYKRAWEEIEYILSNPDATASVNAVKSKKKHRVDDYVKITFIRQDSEQRNKFYCQIDDEMGGEGYILMEDIVPYTVGSVSLRHFFASDGSRYVFDARIIDNIDGEYRFSMIKEIQEWQQHGDYYGYDEEIICSVGNVPNARGYAPAVSREGVSVSIRNAGDFNGIERNTILKCKQVGAAKGTYHILCDAIDVASYEFDINSAFKNLMEDFAVGKKKETPSSQEEEQLLENDKILDESYVREIIYLIDRMALIENDYLKDYNYLGFARILSILIGWESQAAYYKGRMDIIYMLHYFAINEQLAPSKVEELANVNAELFSNNSILKERFYQLQTISFLGKTEHNDELYNRIKNSPSLKTLASLVLAYNITNSNQMQAVANDIHNRIKQELNLKGFESGLKIYGPGHEDEYNEYKTSIIHHAEDPINVINKDKQMDEILKVIASFLNTSGGKLYIGVNDCGAGIGIENDLSNPLFYDDKDKYMRSIIDAVSLKWSNNIATSYIENIGFDSENTDKDVLVVSIKPHPAGVSINDNWYVRVGSTKRKLTKAEYDEFKRTNRKYPVVHNPIAQIEEEPLQTIEITEQPIENTAAFISSKEDSIQTSRIRKNVLVEYEDPDNYVEPVCFFKFLGNGKFHKNSQFDYDDSSLLTLTVLENEVNAYLILGYEKGYIVRVPVCELIEFQERDYARYNDSKLLFASIAHEDDAIMTIGKENKGKQKPFIRLDSITCFDEGKLMDSGQQPCNEGLISDVISYDIVPKSEIPLFANMLDRPKTSVGTALEAVKSDVREKLLSWDIQPF